MSYPEWQYVQMALSIFWSIISWIVIRNKKINLSGILFVWIVIGYNFACGFSNLLRWDQGQYTAASLISSMDYDRATIWWCVSVSVAIGFYLTSLERRSKICGTSNDQIDARLGKIYLFIAVLLLAAFFINPYRAVDFGIFRAARTGDLGVGGFLVSGLILGPLASIASGLLRYSRLMGITFSSITILLFSQTESKAVAVAYLIYLAVFIWTQRKRNLWKKLSIPIAGILLLLATLTLPITVGKRAGRSVTLEESVTASLYRFTIQDAASVVWASPVWRAEYGPTYFINTLSGFLPGTLFPNKPINPAYEINSLYLGGGGYVSAANPSLFGSILLVFGDWFYWPVLLICVYIFMSIDRFFCRDTVVLSIRFDYSWLYFYTMAMIFESNFVAGTLNIIQLILWRYLLLRFARRRNSKVDSVIQTMKKRLPRMSYSPKTRQRA